MKLLFLLFILLKNISLEVNDTFTFVQKEINIFDNIPDIPKVEPVLASYSGYITAYGPDCVGCSGITASGMNVKNNIYYDDMDYGRVRIVAADKSLSFGTIIRINDISDEPVLAIVLDRGGAIGFNRNVYLDLLYPSEKLTLSFGKKYSSFDILRNGF